MTPTIDEVLYDAGRQDAWMAYDPGCRMGDPVGEDEDYVIGWWNGIGEAAAWNKGWAACEAGIHVCPYATPEDDTWRDYWLAGYAGAMAVGEVRHAC